MIASLREFPTVAITGIVGLTAGQRRTDEWYATFTFHASDFYSLDLRIYTLCLQLVFLTTDYKDPTKSMPLALT